MKRWRCYNKGDDKQLSPSFHLREFECKGDGCCSSTIISETLLAILESFRAKVGKPIILNCSYRCPQHNSDVGGTEKSYHQLGMAADIRVLDMTPDEVAEAAEPFFKGIGRYNTFTHVDVRANRVRFDNRS